MLFGRTIVDGAIPNQITNASDGNIENLGLGSVNLVWANHNQFHWNGINDTYHPCVLPSESRNNFFLLLLVERSVTKTYWKEDEQNGKQCGASSKSLNSNKTLQFWSTLNNCGSKFLKKINKLNNFNNQRILNGINPLVIVEIVLFRIVDLKRFHSTT